MHKYLKYSFNAILIAAFAFAFLYFATRSISPQREWAVDSNGLLQYPSDRGKPENVKINLLEDNITYTIEKVSFKSRDAIIYGLLYMPKNANNAPGIIMLPAARAGKEGQNYLAKELVKRGYAFFTIDQRGIGETGGNMPSTQDDFNSFVAGNEPVNHLFVYDALRAFDFLKTRKHIDSSNILIGGESMGARFAVIAGAVDKNFKGVFVISTSGYGKQSNLPMEGKFMASIDPDWYIDKISPRKLVFFHSKSDNVVPFAQAQNTFSFAKEPKEFIEMPSVCIHGQCQEMYESLFEKLNEMAK
ncbi:MAG: alpha/beta hydrolase [Candidatus Nanoarchaeia archaeon]|nr:alpha/beta hydrolase [Candidatus Nanoarchaeia archaeon]